MLDVLEQRSAEINPLLVATSCPSGPLTAECYDSLKTELIKRLERKLPVDGVLLALHGSASADNVGDLEGDLLFAVRQIVWAMLAYTRLATYSTRRVARPPRFVT